MIRRPKMRRLQGYVEGQKAAETEKAESAKKTRIGSPDWSKGKNRWKSWLRRASLLCVRCWGCVPDAPAGGGRGCFALDAVAVCLREVDSGLSDSVRPE
jgi:hypothetical protein